jgi:hypothetical protein
MPLVRDERNHDPEEDDDDPNDVRHRDHDLSESAPLEDWYQDEAVKPWFTRRWMLIIVAVLVIVGLLFPTLRIIL